MTVEQKKYSFADHPEHEAQLEAWRDKWIANALSTEPANREIMAKAVNGLYEAANLDLPLSILFVRSPLAVAIAGGVAAGIWWLRENPDEQQKMFNRVWTDSEMMAMIRPAAEGSIEAALKKSGQSILDYAGVLHDAVVAATEATMPTAQLDEGSSGKKITKAVNKSMLEYLVGCTRFWHRMYDGGSDWSGYPAYLSFFDRVANLNLPIYEKWRHYEQAALYGGPRIMHAKFCIVSDRQTLIKLDQNNQLHCEDGPAKTYADGWILNYWHGVHVPHDFFEWDTNRVLREENSEVRRCGIERLGWEKIIDRLKLVAEAPDPGNDGKTLRLYKGDLIENLYDEPARLLVVSNGSVDKGGHTRIFGLPVPGNVSDPVEAAAMLFDVPVDVYRQLARRT